MPVKTIGGVELYYEIAGTGREAVAFINGIGMTVDSWQPIGERFLGRGFRCLFHDCRGQLRSAKPVDGDFSMEQHATDFVELLDALGFDKVHVVGTSYGSEIGMLVACAYSERIETLPFTSRATSKQTRSLAAPSRRGSEGRTKTFSFSCEPQKKIG